MRIRALTSLSPLRLRREIVQLSRAIEDVRLHLERRSDELASRISEVGGQALAGIEMADRMRYNSRADRILATMLWIESADIPEDTLVSVITATWNRAASLARAIESVRAQSYRNWEMVIVDDGSTDGTAEMIEALDEPRIRHFLVEHGGSAAARNRGLAEARGRVLAYLDSDNTLHRHWLRSAVWAFRERPEVDVLYGAHVRESDRDLAETEEIGLPAVLFRPFDRRELEEYSYIDLGSIAHRSNLAEARFDETFSVTEDYDLILRLTADKPALALPVVACMYHMSGADRLSATAPVGDEVELIRRRLRSPLP